ncbi:unnamed protein product [Diamesa serratosioi]
MYSEDFFWNSVEAIYGSIPDLVKMVMSINGFDSLLTLKGLHWEDKRQFFKEMEETVTNLMYLDECNINRKDFEEELLKNNQILSQFKLKLGHKNLVLNLCHLLTDVTLDEFLQRTDITSDNLKEMKPKYSELVLKQEQVYSNKDEVAQEIEQEIDDEHVEEYNQVEEIFVEELYEEVEYVEQVEAEPETDNENVCFVNYETEYFPPTKKTKKEIKSTNYEADEASEFIISDFPGKLEFKDTFCELPKKNRRRQRIHKKYTDDDGGILNRWHDLIEQSLEVVLPKEMYDQHNFKSLNIIKLTDTTWEVDCPLCIMKLRLTIIREGKYTNYKRSNFERHLRNIHLRCIKYDLTEYDEQAI